MFEYIRKQISIARTVAVISILAMKYNFQIDPNADKDTIAMIMALVIKTNLSNKNVAKLILKMHTLSV